MKLWIDGPDPADRATRPDFRGIIAANEALDSAQPEPAEAVNAAREAADSWAMTGVAQGISRQEAQRRFDVTD